VCIGCYLLIVNLRWLVAKVKKCQLLPEKKVKNVEDDKTETGQNIKKKINKHPGGNDEMAERI
jgi:hypothetical protein